MAEAAGVVVGVLSLAVEAVKVYRELGEIFQAIRHYSREVSDPSQEDACSF